MNSEIKKLWVSALRSGNYKQGGGALCRWIDGRLTYCCLGVLCEIAVDHDVTAKYKLLDGVHIYGDASAGLPEQVQQWADLKYTNPPVDIGDRHTSLIQLNDDDGLSFSQIADIIEAKL